MGEKGLGEKSTFEMEKELSRREGSRERETMPFLLLTDRSHPIPEPGVLAQGGWLLVPCVPKLDSLDSDNSHETTSSSCCSPSPSLPSLWHRFTPLFSQGDIPKVQNLELEQWRGGVMGQQVPARPLSPRPQTVHLPSLLPTPPLLPEHKQSLSNQKRGCLLQLAPERQI